MAEILLVLGCRHSPVGHACFQGLKLWEQDVSDAFQDGHVLGGPACAETAVLFVKGNIPDPVMDVSGSPLLTYPLKQGSSLVLQF